MISVVLATYNEEKMLEKCLAAVADIADEIVIADGESTDSTRDIAKKFKAKIIITTNKPNFHINKQMAMDAAKGDLVLQLDADEIVDKALKKFIIDLHQQIIDKTYDKPAVAWWIKRKNYFLGTFLKKGGQYPDPLIRLYLKGKAELPQKDVHEQMTVFGETGWAEGHFMHYGTPTFSDYIRKFNTYSSFRAKQLYEDKTPLNFKNCILFTLIKPFTTWFSLFIRHKGFIDGIPGFVFATMSGLMHTVSYIKLWELYQETEK